MQKAIVFMCMHTQSFPTVSDPMDCSPPDSSVHGISRQEYWSRLPFPSPGDLPDPKIEPVSPVSLLLWQVDCLPLNKQRKTSFLNKLIFTEIRG